MCVIVESVHAHRLARKRGISKPANHVHISKETQNPISVSIAAKEERARDRILEWISPPVNAATADKVFTVIVPSKSLTGSSHLPCPLSRSRP